MIKQGKGGTRIPVSDVNHLEPEVLPADEEYQSDDAGIGPAVVSCDDAFTEWRDIALRLKADMENYRKRQQRWAQEEVQREKDRLLSGFVRVLDDLEQAVLHLDPNSVTHQGVKIAYDNMVKILDQQGVERVEALNIAFDPTWHEAVAMVPGPHSQSVPLLVSEVVNPGYRIGDRLLRPSRVIVAKRMD